MKKFFSLALAALVIGLASCSKDNTLETPNGGDDGLSSISFTFNKPKEAYVQTYADIATTAEWFIETLDVYAAVDGTVTKLTKDTHYTQVDSEKAYTITMKSDWVSPNTGKTVNFYFVGNDATSIEGAQSELAQTAEADFKNALTDEITLDGTKVKLIEANGSTKNLLFSAVIENVRVVGKVQKSGTLKRREARFDIVNTDNTNVTINKIYVSDASRKGLIFTNADVATPVITKGSHKDIAGPTVYDAAGLATSVFYLYPTTLSETGTKIYLEATANGNTSMYQVEVANDFEILPNYRYKIVLDPATMVFTLVVADYDEGDEFPTTEITAPGLISLVRNVGTGIASTFSYQLVANETSHIIATLGAHSAQGFDVTVNGHTVTGLDQATIAGNMTVGAVTYASAYYPVTVDLHPVYGAADPDARVVVTFTDKTNPSNTCSILFYDATATEAVTLGSINYPDLYDGTYFYANSNMSGKVVVPVKSIDGTEISEMTFVANVGANLSYTKTSTNLIDYTKSTMVTIPDGTVDSYIFDLPVTSVDHKDKPFDILVTFKAKADATKTTTIHFIRMTSVPAVAGILSYEAGGAGLNLDGRGKPLYFKWGSLIGTDASQPYSGAAFNAATDVLFIPATYAGAPILDWASIPYGDQETYPTTFPPQDEAAGLGDPCKLVGDFKMPAGNPYVAVSGDGIWGVNDNNALGCTWDTQFYPAGGSRGNYGEWAGLVYSVGRSGHYWSSTPSGAGAYSLYFSSGSVIANAWYKRNHSFNVRCVPAN